jgi:hypothetical protein
MIFDRSSSQTIRQLIKQVAYPILRSRPDFLILGAQKAGTTSLYRYLSQHPQILANNSWKEVRYFDIPENYSRGFGWYLGNFPWKFQKQNKLTCDASPNYLYFPHVPQLIQQDLGKIKMMAILRNPVDRAYSGWQMYHSFADNPHQHLREIADRRSFREAIEQELTPDLNTAKYPYDYIDRGKYVYQLENYYKYFNRDSILILNLDGFSKNLESTLDRVCDFLNIKRFDRELLQQFQSEKHNVGQYRQDPGDLEVMERLRKYFIPFNQKLYQLLDCDYHW